MQKLNTDVLLRAQDADLKLDLKLEEKQSKSPSDIQSLMLTSGDLISQEKIKDADTRGNCDRSVLLTSTTHSADRSG